MTLDETLSDVMALLAGGVSDPKSLFRVPTLGTVAADGTPEQRTVVVRTFDAPSRRLSVHTDSRSAKFGQLQKIPAVALHVWDPARRLQVRLLGIATVHAGDEVARAAWDALGPLTRQLYRIRQTPGSALPEPSPRQFGEVPEAAGFAFFSAIWITLTRVETLRLTEHGQVRARFDWAQDRLSAAWLVP